MALRRGRKTIRMKSKRIGKEPKTVVEGDLGLILLIGPGRLIAIETKGSKATTTCQLERTSTSGVRRSNAKRKAKRF